MRKISLLLFSQSIFITEAFTKQQLQKVVYHVFWQNFQRSQTSILIFDFTLLQHYYIWTGAIPLVAIPILWTGDTPRGYTNTMDWSYTPRGHTLTSAALMLVAPLASKPSTNSKLKIKIDNLKQI